MDLFVISFEEVVLHAVVLVGDKRVERDIVQGIENVDAHFRVRLFQFLNEEFRLHPL